jgi:hypothetical protein
MIGAPAGLEKYLTVTPPYFEREIKIPADTIITPSLYPSEKPC